MWALWTKSYEFILRNPSPNTWRVILFSGSELRDKHDDGVLTDILRWLAFCIFLVARFRDRCSLLSYSKHIFYFSSSSQILCYNLKAKTETIVLNAAEQNYFVVVGDYVIISYMIMEGNFPLYLFGICAIVVIVGIFTYMYVVGN